MPTTLSGEQREFLSAADLTWSSGYNTRIRGDDLKLRGGTFTVRVVRVERGGTTDGRGIRDLSKFATGACVAEATDPEEQNALDAAIASARAALGWAPPEPTDPASVLRARLAAAEAQQAELQALVAARGPTSPNEVDVSDEEDDYD